MFPSSIYTDDGAVVTDSSTARIHDHSHQESEGEKIVITDPGGIPMIKQRVKPSHRSQRGAKVRGPQRRKRLIRVDSHGGFIDACWLRVPLELQ